MPVTIATPDPAPLAPDLLARWRRVPVAVVVDLAPETQIDPAIRPLRPAKKQPPLCARAVTVRCAAPDFGAVLRALEHVRAGEVLVIDAGGHAGNAMIGDVLGGHLRDIGATGIVCDGAVRDVGNLARMKGFSVYARHINPRGPTGAGEGAVNEPVRIGGRAVAPGDLILGDDDGLACLTPMQAEALIEAAEARIAQEEDWSAQLAAGAPVTAIFGLD